LAAGGADETVVGATFSTLGAIFFSDIFISYFTIDDFFGTAAGLALAFFGVALDTAFLTVFLAGFETTFLAFTAVFAFATGLAFDFALTFLGAFFLATLAVDFFFALAMV
jgi:hypothetical protein